MRRTMKLVWHHPGMEQKESIRFLFAGVVTGEVEDPEFTCFDDHAIHVVSVIFKPFREMETYFEQCRKSCRNLVLYHAGGDPFAEGLAIYRHFDNVVRETSTFDLTTTGIALVPRVGRENARVAQTNASSQRALIWAYFGELRSYPAPMMKQFAIVPYGKVTSTTMTPGVSRNEYSEVLGDTVFMPCGDGDAASTSRRIHDALEAGAIPIVKTGLAPAGYLKALGSHPLPMFSTWRSGARFANAMMDKDSSLDALQTTMLTWWGGHKRKCTGAVRSMLADSHALDLQAVSKK